MTSQVFLPIIILFFLQSHLTYALQANSTGFEFDLNNFSGVLRRGDNTKLVHELKKHLIYLGYLHPNNLGNENNFDQHFEHAVKKYQEFYGLNVTRVVDVNTITSIRKPRCGVPDFFGPQSHFKSLYSFFPGNPRWRKRRLTYEIYETVIEAYILPIKQALEAWQANTHFKFFPQKHTVHDEPDIKISFENEDNEEDSPFPPHCEFLAKSNFPPTGIVYFNANKRWASDGDQNAFDIQTAALHEFGHMLGLYHSTVRGAIMFPSLGLGEKRGLHQDDIDGIKALYELEDD